MILEIITVYHRQKRSIVTDQKKNIFFNYYYYFEGSGRGKTCRGVTAREDPFRRGGFVLVLDAGYLKEKKKKHRDEQRWEICFVVTSFGL